MHGQQYIKLRRIVNKSSRDMLLQAQRGSEGVTPTIRNLGARRRWGVGLNRRLFFPTAKTLYPLCRRLSNPRGPVWTARKILPPPGLDPRSIQPVAYRDTNYAVLAAT